MKLGRSSKARPTAAAVLICLLLPCSALIAETAGLGVRKEQ
jgi:hypothetical protein